MKREKRQLRKKERKKERKKKTMASRRLASLFGSIKRSSASSSSSSSSSSSATPSLVGRFCTGGSGNKENGCDYKHWLIQVDEPGGTRDQMIESYVKLIANVLGSEDEARKKIYSISTKYYYFAVGVNQATKDYDRQGGHSGEGSSSCYI
ncbi:hypothetical protein AgCh_000102 [Apium graveolens]